MGPFTVIY